MKSDVLFFFDKHPEALPVYEELEKRILEDIPNVRIKVQKSQISFYNKHLFACVSFIRPVKNFHYPPSYMTVTFGLNRKAESPEISAVTEPYPSRWTHHIVISSPEEISRQLMEWIKEAAEFSSNK